MAIRTFRSDAARKPKDHIVNASVRLFAFRSCPFCGSDKAPRFWTTADLHEGCNFDDGGEAYHAVVCCAAKPHGPGGCGASGGFQPTRELAAQVWNRRA